MLKVSKDACIGCGACQALVSDVFDIDDDGLAFIRENADIEKYIDDVNDAIDGCPTGAISMED
ncbi:MAG: ferredoxin [Bacilli bacterium]|nr:ferredoxin [Bacilli bacterium]